MEVARIYEDLLEDEARAEAVYKRVIDIDPQDGGLVIPAAQALGRIYAARSRNEELADALGIEVRLEQDVARRRELYERIGGLHETVLKDAQKAIAAWRARLADDEADTVALGALERLYEGTGEHRELVGVLRKREQVETAGGERRRTMTKAAETLADRIGDVPEAITAWRAVLDEFGPERPTLAALEALYEKAERWADLAETLEVDLSLAEDTESQPRPPRAARRRAAPAPERPARRARRLQKGAASSTRPAPRAARRSRPCSTSPTRGGRRPRRCGRSTRPTETPSACSGCWRSRSRRRTIRPSASTPCRPRSGRRRARSATPAAPSATRFRAWSRPPASVRCRRGSTRSSASPMPPGGGSEVSVLLPEDRRRASSTATCSRTRASASASCCRTKLGDKALAIAEYKKALDARGDDRRAMIALEELYAEAGAPSDLLAILKLRVENAESDDEKKRLLFREAELQRGPARRPGRRDRHVRGDPRRRAGARRHRRARGALPRGRALAGPHRAVRAAARRQGRHRGRSPGEHRPDRPRQHRRRAARLRRARARRSPPTPRTRGPSPSWRACSRTPATPSTGPARARCSSRSTCAAPTGPR